VSPAPTAVRRTLAVALVFSFAASIPALEAAARRARGRTQAAGVSAAAVVGAGPHFGNPVAITVEASGSYAVADTNWRTLLRVNRLTGQREPVGPSVPSLRRRQSTAIGPDEAGTLIVGETTVRSPWAP
jgi:hypothetical protein